MSEIIPNQTTAAAQLLPKGGATVYSEGLATPEPTPGPDVDWNAADQLRKSIERSALEEVLGLKIDPQSFQVEQIKSIYIEKAPTASKNESEWSALATACVATGVSKEWIDETNRKLKLVLDQHEKAMSLEEIEQILGIKNLPGVDQLKDIETIYMTKAPQIAHDVEAWQRLQAAVEASGITSGRIEAMNHELKLTQDIEEDEEMEDEEAMTFVQEVYTRVTPTIENILRGNDDRELHLEILEANQAIEEWQKSHPDKEDMINSIDIKRIEDIVINAHFQAAKFEKDPTNMRAKEQFHSREQELAELVDASSYPSTWVLKPLLEAPVPTTPAVTIPAVTIPAVTVSTPTTPAPTSPVTTKTSNTILEKNVIDTDPYVLNKLYAGKPGFTEDGEMIMGHKFKYFQKGDKKGQVHSGQLFVAVGPQAFPHIKVLPRKDFTKNIVDAYLDCAHAVAVGGRTEKDEFVKILLVATESCGPDPLKEPATYAMCERKEGDPIWTSRTDLQNWLESRRAADKMIQKRMNEEKDARDQFYSTHGIKEDPERRDRVEDKRARIYKGKTSTSSIEDRTFPFVGQSVSRAIKAEGQPTTSVEAQGAFDPTSFLSFTAWYERKHNLKLGADPVELTKMMAAFQIIQDTLSL